MRFSPAEQLILALLSTRGECYGLELVDASAGRLKRGGIYVTLGRMAEKGLVESAGREGGRRRYRLTALGERALLATRIFRGEVPLGART